MRKRGAESPETGGCRAAAGLGSVFGRANRSGRTSEAGEGPLTTEVRLALVMNGGVSLAVWMGGVTHELDLIRRASLVARECRESREEDYRGVAADDVEVFEFWKNLLKDAGKHVRIDVISGTSAGGLNGLLLATAIAREAPLPNLRRMWADEASLEKLLNLDRPPKSVLDGTKFTELIDGALNEIPAGAVPSEETVTLFVTATALDGRARRYQDGFGGQFDVRDHRRMYRFKNQPRGTTLDNIRSWKYVDKDGAWVFEPVGRRQFTPIWQEALLNAARATASFPVAFAPVSEFPMLRNRIRPELKFNYRASSVMDGGVLNNAPFAPVLEEITKRRVHEQPVERVVVYVVPSSGLLGEEKVKSQEPQNISPVTTAMNAVNFPTEADFRSGTEELTRYIECAGRGNTEDLFKRLIKGGREQNEETRRAAESVFGEYQRARIKGAIWEVLTKHVRLQEVTPLVTPHELDDKAIEDILKRGGRNYCWFPDSKESLRTLDFRNWNWGVVPAERVLQVLGDHLHERVRLGREQQPQEDLLTDTQKHRCMEGAQAINRYLRKLQAVRAALETQLDPQGGPGPGVGPRDAVDLLEKVFTRLDLPRTVGTLVKDAAKAYLETVRATGLSVAWASAEEVVLACLVVEVLTRAFAPLAELYAPLTPRFHFLRLGPDQMGPLFDMDWLADIGAEKLYGVRFRHFGAFIDADWRRSDFAWGRLDAAHHLLPLVLSDDVDHVVETELHKRILKAEYGDSAVEHMRERVQKLAGTSDSLLLRSGGSRVVKPIRKAGKVAIRLAPASVRWPLRLLWAVTWWIWLRIPLRSRLRARGSRFAYRWRKLRHLRIPVAGPVTAPRRRLTLAKAARRAVRVVAPLAFLTPLIIGWIIGHFV
ncbi:DUF3376 domain-containing protein [Streptomyces sp900116325]|uniref:DUF3376 domain-containing protein n=1 Tax=Streptomyces sp. 900116325 TaxID=3154295 RepID=UPI00339EAE70